jgi:putative endonuclease
LPRLFGEMAEWSIAAVLSEWIPTGKTFEPLRVPGGANSKNKQIKLMSFFSYVLKSTNYNRRYIGSCEDIEIRLKRHNSGKVLSSKAYKPYIVIYKEEFETRTEAIKREKFFKSIDGYNFLKNIGVYD